MPGMHLTGRFRLPPTVHVLGHFNPNRINVVWSNRREQYDACVLHVFVRTVRYLMQRVKIMSNLNSTATYI